MDAALAFKKTLALSDRQLGSLLGVAGTTVARWRQRRACLDAMNGDRLLRSARLFCVACEVLDESSDAIRWFKSPQPSLRGATPLTLATDTTPCAAWRYHAKFSPS
jgi:putative toxin-antitoxin system antitoxin component (TIGR02293 family)